MHNNCLRNYECMHWHVQMRTTIVRTVEEGKEEEKKQKKESYLISGVSFCSSFRFNSDSLGTGYYSSAVIEHYCVNWEDERKWKINRAKNRKTGALSTRITDLMQCKKNFFGGIRKKRIDPNTPNTLECTYRYIIVNRKKKKEIKNQIHYSR